MARLTPTDKEALRELSRRGWVQSAAEKAPASPPRSPTSIRAYCRWVALLGRLPHPPKPVRFTGSHWKI